MSAHLTRWQSLTLSPADRTILDQMENEQCQLTKSGITTIASASGHGSRITKPKDAPPPKLAT